MYFQFVNYVGRLLGEGAALFRIALTGHSEDYTRIPIGRAVVLLAVPMVLELVVESVLVVVDIFFVARLGADAVAAVGLTEAVVSVLDAIAIGLGVATTSLVARRIGAGDHDGAAVAAGQALWIGLVIAAAGGVGGALYAADLLQLMGASDAVLNGGRGYAEVLLGGSGTIVLLYVLNACLRGAGDAAVTLRALWIANGVNLLLDPVLIFGWGPVPAYGVTGAAIASTIGRASGIAYPLWRLAKGNTRLRLHRRSLVPTTDVMGRLLRLSFGTVMQFGIETASWIALVRIVAYYGSAAVAGFTIAARILTFTLLPAWGLGNAAATLVGQNLGSGSPERAERSVWFSAQYNLAYLVLVGMVFIFYPEAMLRLFTSDPEVLHFGVDCLRIVSYGFAVYAIGMVLVQSLNGAGATHVPMWIKFISHWLVQIPLAYLLAETVDLGPRGVFLAILISETVLTGLGIAAFRSGQWKRVNV